MRPEYGRKGPARILVVDDEKTIALSMAAILAQSGYKVERAFNGEEAVALAVGFEPDLLLTDISMGTMSGIEAASEITANLAECKVLFLSGHASMSDIAAVAPRRLVFSLAPKPIHPLDMLNTVAYMLPDFCMADAMDVDRDSVKGRFAANWMALDPARCQAAQSIPRSVSVPAPFQSRPSWPGQVQ